MGDHSHGKKLVLGSREQTSRMMFVCILLFQIHLILLLWSNKKRLAEQVVSVESHRTSVTHPHKHSWPWAGRETFVPAAQPACGGTEPKQTVRMPHSLSIPSSSPRFLNFEHLCSVNPFCVFLHSGFRPADPSQGSHVGNCKPWDVPSDQPEPSRVRTGVPARTHTL